MGNWRITIEGLGPHHNENYQFDADRMMEWFVGKLKEASQNVLNATFEVTPPPSTPTDPPLFWHPV